MLSFTVTFRLGRASKGDGSSLKYSQRVASVTCRFWFPSLEIWKNRLDLDVTMSSEEQKHIRGFDY